VRAILDGRKTQTRRVIKPQPSYENEFWRWIPKQPYDINMDHLNASLINHLCPYGQPGDRLWVRETWGAVFPAMEPVPLEACTIEYRADLPPGCTDYPGNWPAEEARGDPDAPKWRSPIYMPHSFSRITLEITDVRVERLQDISEEDAIAEGCTPWVKDGSMIDTAASDFAQLWNSINGKKYPWESNPWVWVIEFERVTP